MPDPISWSHSGPYYLAALLFGYLLGSIPFGLLLTRLAGTADLRSIGSGNIGATNVLRTGRKDLAAATLLLDGLKGTAAVLIAAAWGPPVAVIAGFAAFVGHLFPVWLGFRGGKGVATYLGVTLGLWWPGALVFAAVWLSLAFLTRYSSLAALVATLAVPLVRAALDWPAGLAPALAVTRIGPEAEALAVMALLCWIRHAANIRRLLAGTESKIGAKAGRPAGEAGG